MALECTIFVNGLSSVIVFNEIRNCKFPKKGDLEIWRDNAKKEEEFNYAAT